MNDLMKLTPKNALRVARARGGWIHLYHANGSLITKFQTKAKHRLIKKQLQSMDTQNLFLRRLSA